MFNLKKIISGNEWPFILIVSSVILLFTILPTVSALYFSSSRDLYYTGASLASPVDRTVYLSQIEEARQGHIFIHNLFTSEPQVGYVSPLWVTLGNLAKVFSLSPLFIFHLARLFLGFILLLVIYLFISCVWTDIKWRRVGFLAVTLNSSLYLNLASLSPANFNGYFGIDLWFNDGNAFLSLYNSPLAIISQTLIFLFFWWIIKRLGVAKFSETAAMGLLLLCLGALHPYDLVMIFVVSSVWFILQYFASTVFIWRKFFKLAMIYGFMTLPAIYFFILKTFSAGFYGWFQQNVNLSPPPFYFLRSFGIMSVFFLIGVVCSRKIRNGALKFLFVWAVIAWLLLYFPAPFQRKLGNGMYLPVVLIGLYGIRFLINKLKQHPTVLIFNGKVIQYAAIVLIILIFSLNTINFIKIETDIAAQNKYFFIKQEEKEAMVWLKQNIQSDKVVASSSATGNIIPSISGRYVYLGHGHQTNNWQAKRFEVEEVFFKTNGNDKYKRKWLIENNINYVYYGHNESELGEYNPEDKPYLKKVFQNNEVKIYQVI